jgi:hypothetical protein
VAAEPALAVLVSERGFVLLGIPESLLFPASWVDSLESEGVFSVPALAAEAAFSVVCLLSVSVSVSMSSEVQASAVTAMPQVASRRNARRARAEDKPKLFIAFSL